MAYDLSTYAGRQAARDAAAAAGRNVVVDAGGVYDRGTGQTSAGIGQSAPAVSSNDQAVLDAFKASSGFSLKDLAERKRQFDANLEWTKQMWANQGLPQLEIQQRAAQLARDEFESQKAIAQQNLALAQKAQAAQESQFGQTLAEQQRQFAADFGLRQGTLGLDYMKTAASMGGPADVFQAADFTRGVAQSGNAPAFLQALRNNTGLAAFNAPSGAAPQALTPDVIAGRLTTGATPGQTNPALQAIGGIAQAGGSALSPQAMESLNPDELAAMGSGFKKLGYSLPAFLSQYQQSRIAQGAAQAA